MKYIPKAVTRVASRSLLKLEIHSPTILVVTGVVGFGATAVLAAKASRVAEPVVEQHKKDRIQINELALSSKQEQRDVVKLYSETTVTLGKIYGPTIVVGALSAASILYGHKILRGRHVASLLAYSGLQEQFKTYRERVAKTLGEDAERDIYDGAHGEWIEDPDHKGEFKLAPVFGELAPTYLRPWFDERNESFRSDPVGNYLFLKGVQNNANIMYQVKGHLFLNDVLKDLGLPTVPEGQAAGWLRGEGDDVIDFGFMIGNDPHTEAFRDGRVNTVRLNFNVAGNIYEMMLDKDVKSLNELGL